MEQKDVNLEQLQDFVSVHDLQNRHSRISFYAIITIQTAKNRITNQKMVVSISFDGYDNYGVVTLLEN